MGAIAALIPDWPQERDLARYAEFTQLDFDALLVDNMRWMDMGCRTGIALKQALEKKNIIAIGVNAHYIEVKKPIIPILARLPEDLFIYEEYQHSLDLLTDIHGAISYADNPLEVLIYEACLLKQNAQAVLVTLENRMIMSNADMLLKIQDFFVKKLQCAIEFQPFTSYTHHTKSPIKTLRIIITAQGRSPFTLPELILSAKENFGIPKKMNVLGETMSKRAQIWQVEYI